MSKHCRCPVLLYLDILTTHCYLLTTHCFILTTHCYLLTMSLRGAIKSQTQKGVSCLKTAVSFLCSACLDVPKHYCNLGCRLLSIPSCHLTVSLRGVGWAITNSCMYQVERGFWHLSGRPGGGWSKQERGETDLLVLVRAGQMLGAVQVHEHSRHCSNRIYVAVCCIELQCIVVCCSVLIGA